MCVVIDGVLDDLGLDLDWKLEKPWKDLRGSRWLRMVRWAYALFDSTCEALEFNLVG